MWRAVFLALGIYACILGFQCLVLDKAVLRAKRPSGAFSASASKEIAPPDWAPWSLLSAGAVTTLYSFTLPKRMGAGK